ncbi:MAG: hypothetical protein JXO72_09640 [Vicinamibacteria bacterium]|nr:hypothetical protein [Vicinamibacteria bacterium]
MACGAAIGMTSMSDAARQAGPRGDMAGAALALMVVICVGVGFPTSMLTLVVAKVLRRPAPNRLLSRLGLSIVGGSVIGAVGSNSGGMTTAVAWLLLLGVPVVLSWPWRAKNRRDVKTG